MKKEEEIIRDKKGEELRLLGFVAILISIWTSDMTFSACIGYIGLALIVVGIMYSIKWWNE